MLIPLTSGAYQAKSIIADAQRCVNLYPEVNPKDSPVPTTHYLTPGTMFLARNITGAFRCLYLASNGNIYGVVDRNVYLITGSVGIGYTFVMLGTLLTDSGALVYAADNGLVLIIVDGTNNGYAVDLTTNNFGVILDPDFLGADRVDYLDTFFLFNVPATNKWYISLSEVTFLMLTGVPGSILTGTITSAGGSYTDGTYLSTPLTGGSGSGATANIVVSGGVISSVAIVLAGTGYVSGDIVSASVTGGTGFTFGIATVGGSAFDPLDIAAKTGYPDPIQAIIVMHLEIWLIGTQTTEVWYNAGAADFVFQILPGIFIEHGCAAKYSVARQDLSIYWISQDKQGQCIVLKGNNYAATRISTYALEQEFSTYSTISDAIGFTYQQDGHVFYVLTFPTANKTWVWDESSELWHQRAALRSQKGIETDGTLNRISANCCCNDSGVILVGSYYDGGLYQYSTNVYTDNGDPIPRIRTFPHLIKDQNRVSYVRFIADMECGTDDSTITNDGTSSTNPPMVSLRWSDTRGRNYGNKVEQSLGAVGQYLTNVQWWRLGMARDRVFELSWSVPAKTALNGAWVEVEPSES